MNQKLWPSGLRVLVIDDNSTYLSIMEELLTKCSYKVTIYKNVREAMSFIYGNLQTLDLIISDVFFPTEDGLLILQEVALKFDIPTVIMSSTGDTSIVMKYITNGASDFLIKPVRIQELKNIWQHVFRKQIGEHKKNNNAQLAHRLSYPPTIAPSTCATREGEIRDINRMVTDIRDLSKSRLSWTSQLHRQFIAAVNSLGVERAVPKKILKMMKVKNLTREQVASHLQKYRLHQRKSTQTLCSDDATSSSSHPNEANILKNQFNRSSYSTNFDQDNCMEMTGYSLLQDDQTSGSNGMLGEPNYSPEGFQDFRWDSDKQASQTYLWNFQAE